jgi:hypothetical protein
MGVEDAAGAALSRSAQAPYQDTERLTREKCALVNRSETDRFLHCGVVADDDAFEIRAPVGDRITVERLGRQRYLLCASGHFRVGWQAQVAAALSEAALTVVAGFTARDGFGRWRGEIEFDRLSDSVDPDSIDWNAVLRLPVSRKLHKIVRFESANLERVPAYGESLRLSVRGDDAVGVLATLLAGCAELELHPLELRIRTVLGKIDDLAFLKAGDLRVPSHQSENALRSWLREGVVN